MSRASVVLKFFLSQTPMLLQNAAKGWNSLGHRRSNLWATELGIYYSNVYGKISFAPLNILASVSLHIIYVSDTWMGQYLASDEHRYIEDQSN